MAARAVRRIGVLAESLRLGEPSQQLLDRLLVGFPSGGRFQKVKGRRVAVHVERGVGDAGDDLLQQRQMDHGLVRAGNVREAVDGIEALAIVPSRPGSRGSAELVERGLDAVPRGCPVFVFGGLGSELQQASQLVEAARSKELPLLAGGLLAACATLPTFELERGTALEAALILVQGEERQALLDGLDGLLPILARRNGGEAGVREIEVEHGEAALRMRLADAGFRRLLEAAVSRSHSPQGDPVADGRTQDLVGLGRVSELVREPRLWTLRHADGLETTVFRCDGVVDDIDFALATRAGGMLSAQIHVPPGPAEHGFSRLAAVVEEFFASRTSPWPAERAALIAGVRSRVEGLDGKPTAAPLTTPELTVSRGGAK